MKLYFENQLTQDQRAQLLKRPAINDSEVIHRVEAICLDVKQHGDSAIRKYSQLYDSVVPPTFRLTNSEIIHAYTTLSPEVRSAVEIAATNIKLFHQSQRRQPYTVEPIPGIRCWREIRPLETVGLYIPAGSVPLPSTVLMLGIPAQIAGCKRIIICSPPNNEGTVHPIVLAVAYMLGITEIYCVGGAQAIAAMAYGTETIPKVDKIFGPGNKYVTAAKQYVSSDPTGVPVDMLAGPSEVLLLVDETANPEVVAWDCISQAEHDPDSQAVVVTTNHTVAELIAKHISEILSKLPRASIVEQSLSKSYILITNTLEDALLFINDYAPEHLIINMQNAEEFVPSIKNAGSVFLGAFSPVTAGDYASGTNHTLPTSGTARWFSGLTVESFEKSITFQSLTEEGLQRLAPALITFATIEGLYAHSEAVRRRLNKDIIP